MTTSALTDGPLSFKVVIVSGDGEGRSMAEKGEGGKRERER